MINHRTFKTALSVILIAAGLYLLGFIFYWHWSIWWFDILLHLLAGVFLSLLSIFLFSRFFPQKKLSEVQLFLIGILGTLILGLAWEVFQFSVDQFWSQSTDRFNSLKDIYFDLLGGALGSIYFLTIKRNYDKSTNN